MKQPPSRSYFPSRGSLVLAWALLMSLTVGTMFAGRVNTAHQLGPAMLAALFLVTWAKAGVILRQYLNLRTVPAAADAMMILIALILAVVGSLYILAV